MSTSPAPTRPNLAWRLGSQAVMGTVGAASRGFLYGLNTVHVDGLDNLLNVLDRRNAQGRDRGLLTVCNHIAVYVALLEQAKCGARPIADLSHAD